jgi:hypothetical protein
MKSKSRLDCEVSSSGTRNSKKTLSICRVVNALEATNFARSLRRKRIVVLPANVLNYLLDDQRLIPEDWKKDEGGKILYIYFWGTIYSSSVDRLCVFYLYWGGNEWRYDYECLTRTGDQTTWRQCLQVIAKEESSSSDYALEMCVQFRPGQAVRECDRCEGRSALSLYSWYIWNGSRIHWSYRNPPPVRSSKLQTLHGHLGVPQLKFQSCRELEVFVSDIQCNCNMYKQSQETRTI